MWLEFGHFTLGWTNSDTYAKNDKFFNHFEMCMFKFWTSFEKVYRT